MDLVLCYIWVARLFPNLPISVSGFAATVFCGLCSEFYLNLTKKVSPKQAKQNRMDSPSHVFLGIVSSLPDLLAPTPLDHGMLDLSGR